MLVASRSRAALQTGSDEFEPRLAYIWKESVVLVVRKFRKKRARVVGEGPVAAAARLSAYANES